MIPVALRDYSRQGRHLNPIEYNTPHLNGNVAWKSVSASDIVMHFVDPTAGGCGFS